MLKAFLHRLLPRRVINVYHLCLAHFAAFYYGHPSESLIVIGVTGTNGKSTTTAYIGRMLETAGHRVGWTSTVGFKVGSREWMNDKKMTMLGRFQTQKMLREMVEAGCTHAIVETSSQGIDQNRHVAINYDVAVFTNLTAEHIDYHGTFDAYKIAKGKLFEHTKNGTRKEFGGIEQKKIAVVNIDDACAPYFLSFCLDKQYGFGIAGSAREVNLHRFPFVPYEAEQLETTSVCSRWTLEDVEFHLKPLGRFNVYNALAASTVCEALGMTREQTVRAVAVLESVPGRLETIQEGQPYTVIVDYAYEPAAMKALYDTVALIPHARLIQVTGSAGGGRDVGRRRTLGMMAANTADVVIVTNEDPYDDDPKMIMDDVARGAEESGMVEGENLQRILDRQQAINEAMRLAKPGDLVLITGKGCEPVMAVAHGKKIPWDDREAARRALWKLSTTSR